jgi:methyl-CpG-binding domain protein 4
LDQGKRADRWRILVVCVLLNCTSRKQVERVLEDLWTRWPDATAMSAANSIALSECIASLGFGNRRAGTLIALSRDYLKPGWMDARELAGVGEYAGRAWDMFCRGEFGSEPPKDGALVKYWRWLMQRPA